MAGCPGGLSGVSVAEYPQSAVGHGADIGSIGRAEGGECFVPGSPLVWCLVAGFGTDWVAGMVVAVRLAVGGDRGGVVLPPAASGQVGGHRAESADGPSRGGLGGVLAQTPHAVVHHRGDLGQVGLASGVGQPGYPFGPGAT